MDRPAPSEQVGEHWMTRPNAAKACEVGQPACSAMSVWLALVLNCLHHPRQVRLGLLVRPRRLVVGAGEGEEGIGAVRAVVMAGTVLPDAVVVVPFLAVVAQALQAEVAGRLVELAR